MLARGACVEDGGATRHEIGFVGGQRRAQGDGLGLIPWRVVGAAHQLACGFDRLRVAEDLLAVRRLEVIGGAEFLQPLAALSVGRADGPCARRFVAAIGQTQAGTEAQPVRALLDRQAKAGGGGFKRGFSGLWHVRCPGSVWNNRGSYHKARKGAMSKIISLSIS